MKKFTCLILIILLSIFSIPLACSDNSEINIYAPDGAPALALSLVIKSNLDNTNVNIVSSDKIASFVTGKEKKADICILPINMASKLIGSGDDYKMIATITHGNFYFLSMSEMQIDSENVNYLIGKTIGVMQLQNVPGLTLKSVLKDNNLEYATIQDISEKNQNKVNLMAISKVETARSDIDLFLVPSPLADLKVLNTNLNFVGSLSELYSDSGFPQAIIVVKNSLIENNLEYLKEFVKHVKNVNSYLIEENKKEICNNIHSKLERGLIPVFNESNLTYKSIEHSKIAFIDCNACKNGVITFISKLKNLQPNAVEELNDKFFYQGEL